ncbi:protein EDS1-like [Telopea speciosissima]|uniref:protein EDS1-like n=1 Tax=Telopea speciosissima TaxID=54955 RepID=UPI001CC53A01|nr:protein EDS1-like [Telopea speciosissima]
MEGDLVKKALSLAMAAQSKHDRPYQSEKYSDYTIIAFHGSGTTVEDWFSGKPFGETSVGLKKLFPCLKSIGNDEIALVNGKFLQQFQNLLKPEALKQEFRLSDAPPLEHLLKDSRLSDELGRAVRERRKVVFTGYSSGGPIAILAAILFLQQNRIPALCVTFGSPLVGNQIFGHAMRRENWAQHFVHFVMRYDIIPRVLLAPLSSIKGEMQTILPCFDRSKLESKARSQEASSFFCDVMRNSLSVASHTACSFMGCTNSLLQTVTSFVELSPYRPFGTYVFCTGEGKMITLKNPDAILQLLFYSLQLGKGETVPDVACKSITDHLGYQTEFKDNLWKEDVVDLDHLCLQLSLSTGGASSSEMKSIETAIKQLGLSTRAMLCLIAAKEWEKQKQRNQEKIDENRDKIEVALRKLQEYKVRGEMHKIGYYDAFKVQKGAEDFDTNVKRLELAGMWDEIIDKLKRYELPDEFECREDWVELGTRFRRLMEPLDIANYYRHFKDEDTGPYMKPEEGRQPRPKRYRYTQRWLEHAKGKPAGYFLESCFWAAVEDLHIRIHSSNQKENRDVAFEKVKDRVLKLEENVLQWVQDGQLRDVFFEKSTFVKWWSELPEEHCRKSRIATLMGGHGKEFPFDYEMI